jgi:hypothetical protein
MAAIFALASAPFGAILPSSSLSRAHPTGLGALSSPELVADAAPPTVNWSQLSSVAALERQAAADESPRSQAAEDVLLFSTSMRAAPAPPVIGSWALDEDDDFVDDVADDAFLFSTFER